MYIHRAQKTRLNCTQPVVCGSVQSESRFWPTQLQLVIMRLELVESVKNDIFYNKYTYNTLFTYIIKWI